jgi:ubiquinone/menaquinone biosynthesis C-methylase UbiE
VTAWFGDAFDALAGVLAGTGLFFFVATRGALLMRTLSRGSTSDTAHVYPIYSSMRLIRLVDFQPLISAILLFQYHRLVARIVDEMEHTDLVGGKVLITSCAFGDMLPTVVDAAITANASQVLIADIIPNELIHAERKLGSHHGHKVRFIEDDATGMHLGDETVAVNIVFFLLHELPHPLKRRALAEAGRVLAPGGKLMLAEFHRPDVWPLRALSWIYFKVFEPLGLALWSSHDPVALLGVTGRWRCERTTCFHGNFQVVVATKL